MRFSLEAVARFAGLRNYNYRDPGAHAPGFMLAPAPQASNELTTISPRAHAPGFMLAPASQAMFRSLIACTRATSSYFNCRIRACNHVFEINLRAPPDRGSQMSVRGIK